MKSAYFARQHFGGANKKKQIIALYASSRANHFLNLK